jgi:hypothetical protein
MTAIPAVLAPIQDVFPTVTAILKTIADVLAPVAGTGCVAAVTRRAYRAGTPEGGFPGI